MFSEKHRMGRLVIEGFSWAMIQLVHHRFNVPISDILKTAAFGRFVSFKSFASNFVADDTNGKEDVFLHDRKTGMTTRENVSFTGLQSNPGSSGGALSADGRWLAFTSGAALLVPGDSNSRQDVFVRDRLLDTKNTADLALTLTGPGSVAAGSPAVYTLTVTNNGSVNADNTDVISGFSYGGKVKAIVAGQGVCSKAAVSVCRLGILTPGQSVIITATVNVKDTTTINASAQAAAKDSNPGNNAQTLTTTIE